MKGYVINKSPSWAHAMKRSVGPGQKIDLEDLFEQYGEKHGIERGTEFVEWLRTVKLRDVEKWSVVLEDDENVKAGTPEDQAEPVKEIKTITTADKVSPKHMSVQDVAALSVRKAREVLPEISDIKLLKYSLQEANVKPHTDSLCKLLRKRISELEVAGFH